MVGGFGDAEASSFHATKVLHTFEGNAVTTDDDDLAARLRLMRNHGLTPEGEVARLGINGKMNEIAAAMGLSLLEQLDALLAANRRNHLSVGTAWPVSRCSATTRARRTTFNMSWPRSTSRRRRLEEPRVA